MEKGCQVWIARSRLSSESTKTSKLHCNSRGSFESLAQLNLTHPIYLSIDLDEEVEWTDDEYATAMAIMRCAFYAKKPKTDMNNEEEGLAGTCIAKQFRGENFSAANERRNCRALSPYFPRERQ